MGIPTAIRLLPGSAVFVWLASPAAAHGFGQRYELPLPLGLWVLGAGATIVLTFAVTALYLREFHTNWEHLHFNLLKILPIRWLAHPRVVAAIRALSVVAFLATIYAGLAGTDDPYENLITTIVRVIWWVGFAFACALVGNLWALLNPIRTIFVWAEWGFARVTGGGSLARNKPYPRGFQTWPGVVLFIGFAWAELVWAANDVPRNLAIAILGYSAVTGWECLLGAVKFGSGMARHSPSLSAFCRGSRRWMSQ